MVRMVVVLKSGRSHLIPIKKQVSRKGKVFQQTFYARPDEIRRKKPEPKVSDVPKKRKKKYWNGPDGFYMVVGDKTIRVPDNIIQGVVSGFGRSFIIHPSWISSVEEFSLTKLQLTDKETGRQFDVLTGSDVKQIRENFEAVKNIATTEGVNKSFNRGRNRLNFDNAIKPVESGKDIHGREWTRKDLGQLSLWMGDGFILAERIGDKELFAEVADTKKGIKSVYYYRRLAQKIDRLKKAGKPLPNVKGTPLETIYKHARPIPGDVELWRGTSNGTAWCNAKIGDVIPAGVVSFTHRYDTAMGFTEDIFEGPRVVLKLEHSYYRDTVGLDIHEFNTTKKDKGIQKLIDTTYFTIKNFAKEQEMIVVTPKLKIIDMQKKGKDFIVYVMPVDNEDDE